MKRKQLISFLQNLETFEEPRIELEQYATGAMLGAEIIQAIHADQSFEGNTVADLGCGCGLLFLGALQMGADFAVGFDIDRKALQICRENVEYNDLEAFADLVHVDVVRQLSGESRFDGCFDTVVMNPPFGTKNNAGIDLRFVECGLRLLRPGGRLYSLHKSSTRAHILKRRETDALWWQLIAEVRCMAELRWELERTYRYQRHETVDIAVDLIRFTKF